MLERSIKHKKTRFGRMARLRIGFQSLGRMHMCSSVMSVVVDKVGGGVGTCGNMNSGH
jgi:hypothetical protein